MQIFFYWPLGGGAPRAATHYLNTLGLDKYTTTFYGCTGLKIVIKEHNSFQVEGRDSCFPFIYHSSGSPLSRSAAFITSLVALRGELDCPSCARGTGTVLPRRQSQQVHLGGCNNLDIGNLLNPWWRPVPASQFQDLQRLLEKGINKLPVVVLVDHSIAGY